MRTFIAAAIVAVSLVSPGEHLVNSQTRAASPASGVAELEKMTARFAPSDIGAPIAQLPASERQALAKLG